ncbi:DUF357 domain-containing protein [archaeon]|jgi:uncharacterized protein|nr:DUF357 domain-containing protein [archaeon]MBT6762128.1 DUF357 domain-containing protein [archaeon]
MTTNKKINNTITKEKLNKYFSVSQEALTLAKANFNKKTPETEAQAREFFSFAKDYFNDAKHFRDIKNDWVLAFAALNYAHGWLDAGATSGLFVVSNSRLFTVDGPYE